METLAHYSLIFPQERFNFKNEVISPPFFFCPGKDSVYMHSNSRIVQTILATWLSHLNKRMPGGLVSIQRLNMLEFGIRETDVREVAPEDDGNVVFAHLALYFGGVKEITIETPLERAKANKRHFESLLTMNRTRFVGEGIPKVYPQQLRDNT